MIAMREIFPSQLWIGNAGDARDSTQCYSPFVPPVLGGEMVPSNFHAVAPIVHSAFCGQIHQRVKDLPPGTPIKGIELTWK